jgi:hypothetical protein
MRGRQFLSKPDGKGGQFLRLDFQLNFGLSRLGEAKLLCRSPRDINNGRAPRFHPIINGDDDTLAVIKICHSHLGSVGKGFV